MAKRYLIFCIFFLVFALAKETWATTYYQDYGSSDSKNITVVMGTHHFQVNGIARYKNTQWYLTYSGGSPVQTENSGFWAIDPDYSHTFASGTTMWIRAEVYDDNWNWEEAHRWYVTVADTTPPSTPTLQTPSNGSSTSDQTPVSYTTLTLPTSYSV